MSQWAKTIIKDESEKASKLPIGERCRLWCKPIVALVEEGCKQLGQPDAATICAMELLTRLMQQESDQPRWFGKGFSRRDGTILLKASSRVTTAAALVYIASFLKGRKTTQNEIGELYGISNAGLRHKFHRIRDLLSLQI